jgi:hypothetical protein
VQDQPLEDRLGAEALQQLAMAGQSLPAQLPPSRPDLDAAFLALYQSERSSQLIHSLSRLTHTLEQATTMLGNPAVARLCPMGQPTSQSRILLNVFVLFYAGEIQPQMAQVQRLGRPWSESIMQLSSVPEVPSATADYLTLLAAGETSLWQRYQSQISAHSQAWQTVLSNCGMRPGQAGWQGTAPDT